MKQKTTDPANQNTSKRLKSHKPELPTYQALYNQSIHDPDSFWTTIAHQELDWISPFTHVSQGSFQDGDVRWFVNGQLNVSYNCVDRHANAHPDRTAIIWEADEPGHAQHISYKHLLHQVCRVAGMLTQLGVSKGDTVAIYMPMVPAAAYAMLACARIGAVHSVVFAGFSAEALRARIQDAQCKILITADQGKRGGKTIHLKKIADEALKDNQCPSIQKVLVYQRTADPQVPFHPFRDIWWHQLIQEQRPYCPPVPLNAEDPLFLLYTSGSTGTPKGVLHTQAGYLLGALMTTKYVFDHHQDNTIHGCMADVGWITGHTYIVYGPLACGVTTVMFESIPTYPTPSRYWQVVDDHKITAFYTAPTAIRALRKLGDQHVQGFNLDSLRVIGSVGEPINPEAWHWYNNHIGKNKCAVVDTYWQTETGSIVITPLPRGGPTPAGCATLPFFGVDPVILDPTTGKEMPGKDVSGVLAIKKPFPSIARTVYGNHSRYMSAYFNPYPGYYFTGDGAMRDAEGLIWIKGRVDDVINISGHRLSTAEIESALIQHASVAEAAVVGVPDDVSGQAMVCFCTLKTPTQEVKTLSAALRMHIREAVGAFATPKRVYLVPDLPKTRSGKIMRRVLRKVAAGEVHLDLFDAKHSHALNDVLGDLSTLADSGVVLELVRQCYQQGLSN